MNKKFLRLLLIFFVCSSQLLFAQKKDQDRIDSILQKLPSLKVDTNLVKTYGEISKAYYLLDKMSAMGGPKKNLPLNDAAVVQAMSYADKEMTLAKKLNWSNGIGYSYISYGSIYIDQHVFDTGLDWYLKAYNLIGNGYIKQKAAESICIAYISMSMPYLVSKKEEEFFNVVKKALNFFDNQHDKTQLGNIYGWEATMYYLMNKADKRIEYQLKALNTFNAADTSGNHINRLLAVADAYSYKKDLLRALDFDLRAEKLANKKTSKGVLNNLYTNIGDLYSNLNDYPKALAMHKKAFAVDKNNINTSIAIATDYRDMDNYEMAIENDNDALRFHKEDYMRSTLYVDLAKSYYLQKNYSKAFDLLQKSKALQDLSIKTGALQMAPGTRPEELLLGKIFLYAPDSLLLRASVAPGERYKRVEANFNANLSDSKKWLTDERQRDIYKDQSLLYERTGDYKKAYEIYKKYRFIDDSLVKVSNRNEVIRKNMQFSYTQREDSIRFKQQTISNQLKMQLSLADKDKALQQANLKQSQASLQAEQNKRRANEQELIVAQKDEQLQKTIIKDKQTQSYYLFGGIAALLALSFFIAQNYRNQRRATKRSDELLLNILPADVAEELKSKGASEARLFDEVTVLFTDFVNFTHLSELLTPKELVEELNVCFKAFDGIMTNHGIEKIKTIGDAYLAVAGLPHADKNHAVNTINASREIQQFITARKAQLGDKTFNIRIGIHSGSVVAGIVGVKKFAYDIWGDTVNTAARMEQNSEPGKINVSEKTYSLVKDKFVFTYRGEIEAKNKGALKMYFVDSIVTI